MDVDTITFTSQGGNQFTNIGPTPYKPPRLLFEKIYRLIIFMVC